MFEVLLVVCAPQLTLNIYASCVRRRGTHAEKKSQVFKEAFIQWNIKSSFIRLKSTVLHC